MTVETLKDCNKKVLARMAKDQGIVGWHAMRKDQLIRALSPGAPSAKKAANRKSPSPAHRRPRTPAAVRGPVGPAPDPRSPPPRALAPIAPRTLDHGCGKDRIITMVRDPYWLHAHWELSRSTLAGPRPPWGRSGTPPGRSCGSWTSPARTRPAPPSGTSATSRSTAASTTGTSTSTTRRAPSGSTSATSPARGKFYVLARSNVVTHAQGRLRRHARPELGQRRRTQYRADLPPLRRLRPGRPIERPPRAVRGAAPPADEQPLAPEPRHRRVAGRSAASFHFEIDAELIVYGTTEPNAKVTLQGEPVQLRPDGSFTVRFSLPDARQIIPATASSPDGVEERTIVLAVERNTKELEPMIHDGNEL